MSFFVLYSNRDKYGHYMKLMLNTKLDSIVLTVHKALVIDWLTYVRNILQPSFLGPFDVVGPRHLPTVPVP